ncbi:MAG: hypothetical protein L0Y73_03305 [Candidatus Aminicenantes bacterium]|nr:hypothetical protein [Candidatus Aminicenantes bacterium]
MKTITSFSRIKAIIFLSLLCSSSALFSMPRLYFESDDLLLKKILVFIIIGGLGALVARVIYPRLLEKGMSPFKARRIFNATLFSFLVLGYGITFHTTVDILFLSIALGVAMIASMFVAILKS